MGFFFGCFGLNKNKAATTPRSLCDDSMTDHEESDGKVRRYRWEEIQEITKGFSEVIGVGGFSTVYLAWLPDSRLAAVKVYSSGSQRLSQVFRSELEICRQLHHRNIVTFLGYSDDREEGVLVFEYIPNGTLQEKLHTRTKNQGSLKWKTRMAIAYQLARSLEYLHEKCSLHIVHGDIKSSNILLDDCLDCKLCDFGFAKMGFQSMVRSRTSSSNLMGSPGYIDPHYLMTGIASKKSDIYSFGVILLELITGIEAFSSGEERMLCSMMRRRRDNSLDVRKVVGMVDKQIEAEVDEDEVTAMASIAALCLQHMPGLRPSAADVCTLMTEKISSIAFLSSEDKLRSLE